MKRDNVVPVADHHSWSPCERQELHKVIAEDISKLGATLAQLCPSSARFQVRLSGMSDMIL